MSRQEIQIRALLGFSLILLFTILLLLALLSANIAPLPEGPESRDSTMDVVRSRINVGDTRDAAIEHLSDAWFHTTCPYVNSTMIDDLIFYGPRTRDKVEIVLIGSKKENGQVRVNFVGGVDNYELHLYEHCDPAPSSAFVD